ncbi:uncharacterized protein LOC144924116 [Branchiostoma floridae x Branchiostoma belcheri]
MMQCVKGGLLYVLTVIVIQAVAMVTVTRAQDNTISYTGLCGPAACCQSQENEYVRLQDMMVVLVRQVALLQHALGADPDFHWDLSGGCSVTDRQQSPCGDMCTSIRFGPSNGSPWYCSKTLTIFFSLNF